MTEFDTLVNGYLMALDHSKIRINNLPNYLFVCGGSTKKYTVGEGDETKYFSMRGAILDTLCAKYPALNDKVQYAEDYDDWLEHGTVKNLIDFELAIADMAGAIVLILEGPGAFAELGSFSVLKALSEKLILVVNTNIVEERTFINYGPIKYLEDNNKIVLKYKWDVRYALKGINQDKVESKISSRDEVTLNLAARITERISREVQGITTNTLKLDVDKIGHICFIIGDLIYTFYSLRLQEVNGFLKEYFGVKSTLSLVKTCIYILDRFGFVKMIDSGDKYFIATEKNKGFLKHYYDLELREVAHVTTKKSFMDELLTKIAETDKDRFASISEN